MVREDCSGLKEFDIAVLWPAFYNWFLSDTQMPSRLYDQNLALTNGGPYGSTQMVCMNIYRTAFWRK